MFKRLIDFLWPMCPSGIDHRIRVGLVTNINGHTFCWHRDCMAANNLDCREHAHHWEPAFHYDSKLYERCTCGAHRIYGQNKMISEHESH